MIRCYITDRRSLREGDTLTDCIVRILSRPSATPDWIQLREKDLPARDLLELARAIRRVAPSLKLLVNSRVDVALAAGADGAHLPAGSPEARLWRPIAPPGFLIGVSCHSVDEVRAAEAGGADYALFGPVFAPVSKPSGLVPRGLSGLARAVSAGRIPVLALGGITRENRAACLEAGAAGIAGISLFQNC